MDPYYADDAVTLYLGDCREVLPAAGVTADCMVADPPYGETSIIWDRWADGWPQAAASVARSLWCFGSLRMYLAHVAEFRQAWTLSQDIIWEKPYGTGLHDDRFRRVHEQPTHWYQGSWATVYRQPPREAFHGKDAGRRARRGKSEVHGKGSVSNYQDDGSRLVTSVIRMPNLWKTGRGLHPTEKPTGLLEILLDYACPPGGLVIDPFAGSGSTLDAARCTGRRAIGVEIDERYAEAAARRLSQGTLIA